MTKKANPITGVNQTDPQIVLAPKVALVFVVFSTRDPCLGAQHEKKRVSATSKTSHFSCGAPIAPNIFVFFHLGERERAAVFQAAFRGPVKEGSLEGAKTSCNKPPQITYLR